MFDFNIFYRAALHGKKIIFLINPAPINDLVKFGFENEVEPNTGAAPVSFSERMGDIHFHILLDDFIKRGLRHFINVGKCRFKVHQRRKTEVAFWNVYGSEFSGKIVNFIKKILVNCFQCGGFSCFQFIKQPAIKKFKRLFLADMFFLAGKVGSVCQPQFIFKCHSTPPD